MSPPPLPTPAPHTCPHCGTGMETRVPFCPNCGAVIRDKPLAYQTTIDQRIVNTLILICLALLTGTLGTCAIVGDPGDFWVAGVGFYVLTGCCLYGIFNLYRRR